MSNTEEPRYWTTEVDHGEDKALGRDWNGWVGVVDEEQGGIVLVVHEGRAEAVLAALRDGRLVLA